MVGWYADEDDTDPEEPNHLGEMAAGTITQLIEYAKPVRAPKKSNIRIGFHPPHRAYLRKGEKD